MDVRSVIRGLAPLLVLAGLAAPAAAQAETLPTRPDGRLPVIDGTVHALARDGGTLYVGGEFSYVGPRADGPLVRLDASGHPDAGFPRVTSGAWWRASVAAVEPDGAGGVFIGGRFAAVGGVPRRNLAHILADGTVDPGFDPAPDGHVTGLLRDGATLYVAGGFANAGGAARSRLAALDAGTGAATAWDPAPAGRVRALAAAGGTLYVGGDFATIAGQPRAGLAAFAADGTLQDFAPALDGDVTALAADATRLYAAGGFTSADGQPRAHLAAFAGGALDPGWTPAADAPARQLVDAGDRVDVLSRDAQTIAGHTGYGVAVTPDTGAYVADGPTGDAPGVAALDGGRVAASGADGIVASDGSVLGRGVGLAGVTALAPSGGGVVVAGDVRSLGGDERDGLAAVDLTTGTATGWDPGATPGGAVDALAVAGGEVFAGGSFADAGHANLVALDEATGAAQPWNLDADGGVQALAADGPTVYVGGAFSSLGGSPRAHLAAIDAGAVTGWDPGADGTVRALATDGTQIFAGGDFSTLAGASRARLGAVTTAGDAAAWQADADGPVHALATAGGVVYAGGAFTSVGGRPRTGAAALSAADGSVTAWDPQPWTGVDAIAVWRDHVWLGGDAWGYGVVSAHATGDGAWDSVTVLPGAAGALLPLGGSSLALGGASGVDSLSFAPVADASPAVSGTLAAGETLTCEPGTWHEDTLDHSWSWWRDGSPIAGATAPAYVATADDAGHTLTCRETRRNLGGGATAESPPAGVALPAVTTPPALVPAPVAGTTVRCDPGSWSGSPDGYDYRWLRDGDPIPWADGATYTVADADIGAQLSCRVWARKDAARVRADAAAALVPVPPAKLAGPTLAGSSAGAGTARVGDTLTCSPGRWSGDGIAYAYRYLRDGSAVAGATGGAYTVALADLGHRLACQVTATNAGGARRATVTVAVLPGRPVSGAPPAVGGTVQAGATVTCAPGTWSNSPTGWQVRWFLDGARLGTGVALVIADADQGHRLSCDVAAVWSGGTTAPVASAAVTVPFHAPVSVTPPALYGDATPGGSLTCTAGDWRYAGAYTYTWLRDGAAVATGTDLAVVPADAGHRLGCRVTATGPGGSAAADSAVATIAGADHRSGTAAADVLRGGAGDDRLAGGGGDDRLVGGAGADVLLGGAGDDHLVVGSGRDRLYGGAGNDHLVGGSGRDRLSGGAGNDRLDARDHHGGDVVSCGPGRDVALVDRGDRVSRDCETVRRAR